MNASTTERAEGAEGSSDLFRGATFLPDDDSMKVDMLLESVSRNRYTTFVTVYMELRRVAADVCHKTGFSDSVLEVMGLASSYRRELTSDPAFLIWLNLTMAVTNRMLTGQRNQQDPLRKRLIEFSQIRSRFDERKKNESILRVPGTQILVQRFDIDPLIASNTPPSYEFPSDKAKQRELEREGYSLLFFKDVVTVALERMRNTWPDEHEQFARLVKVLGYLPDASFRSCSASRYTGVVYLSSRDNSILDVEESLVHEGGHQLLYNIVESAPVTREDTPVDEMYTLPWSGQQRDFYGYFHAFYIYLLLVKYFERVKGRSKEEQRRASDRMTFILRGLVRALPDFQDNKNFTREGRMLFESLEGQVRGLEGKHQSYLAKGTTLGKSVPLVE